MTCRGLEWCTTLAALAEAHKTIKKPMAKTERIAFSPIAPPSLLCGVPAAPPKL
jgi:hypothetical protein